MILRMFSIFDRKALTYHPPYYAVNEQAAIRTLHDVVADTNTNIGRHPNDFVLYLVGVYDDEKGEVQPIAPLIHVIDAISLAPRPTADLFQQPQADSNRAAAAANGKDA